MKSFRLISFLIFALIAIVVGSSALVSTINNHITPQKAQIILQQQVNYDTSYPKGPVENVQFGFELCSQVSLGYNCKFDVTFKLNERQYPATCIQQTWSPPTCTLHHLGGWYFGVEPVKYHINQPSYP